MYFLNNSYRGFALRFSTTVLALFMAFSVAGFANTEKKQFTVNDSAGRDTIRFVLDAPFEVINGSTNAVKGSFVFEGAKLSGTFSVPVASLKTGISDRDEHLQNDKWMDATKHPQIVLTFAPTKVPDSVWKGTETTLEVPGEFQMHGVKKTEKIKLTLRYFPESEATKKRLPGNLLRAKAEFQLTLSDYAIAQSDSKVKELLGLKVGKAASITADLMASDKSTL
jgi:polyisoprenoid-binding protein YceI